MSHDATSSPDLSWESELPLERLLSVLESLYPLELASDWDRNGLICGDTSAPIRKVLIALDPVSDVVEAAIVGGYDLLLTHHPLYLRGTSFVSTQDPKGALIHRLITHGCALYNAHTNADCAREGVAQALADAVGLPPGSAPLVPAESSEHPGLGRVGDLAEPIRLRDFARLVAKQLPAGPTGLLVGGDLDAPVQRIAVSGGAGDSLLDCAREAGADVFLTADLRHHPASEHLEGGKPYLLNGSHWATEVLWCNYAKAALERETAALGIKIEVDVCEAVTEPWSLWLSTEEE